MVTVVYQCHRLRSSELQCYVDGVLVLNTEVTLPQQEEVRGRGGEEEEEERERGGGGRGRKRERGEGREGGGREREDVCV